MNSLSARLLLCVKGISPTLQMNKPKLKEVK